MSTVTVYRRAAATVPVYRRAAATITVYRALQAAPILLGVSPGSGGIAGGTAITLTGIGFQSGATVLVGGVAATSVVFVGPTSITAVTPAGTLGYATIRVTNPDRQYSELASAYYFTMILLIGGGWFIGDGSLVA